MWSSNHEVPAGNVASTRQEEEGAATETSISAERVPFSKSAISWAEISPAWASAKAPNAAATAVSYLVVMNSANGWNCSPTSTVSGAVWAKVSMRERNV